MKATDRSGVINLAEAEPRIPGPAGERVFYGARGGEAPV